MKALKKTWQLSTFAVVLIIAACSPQVQEEEVNISEVLPENSVIEISGAYPDFKVFLVEENNSNVLVKYKDHHLRIEGIEDADTRERIAKHVTQYLENPNKMEEDKVKRQAYNDLPPKEKMAALVERIKVNHPDFEYEWVGLDEGNVDIEYGDNSLIISGIEDQGSMEEIAHAVYRIQKEIDKVHVQDEEGVQN